MLSTYIHTIQIVQIVFIGIGRGLYLLLFLRHGGVN